MSEHTLKRNGNCAAGPEWPSVMPDAVASSAPTPSDTSAITAESYNVCYDNRLRPSTDGHSGGWRPAERRRVWTVEEMQAGRPACAVCGREISRAVLHHNTRHFFCSREHYYEFRRAGKPYRENRSGQRYARKVAARYTSLPPGAVVHHWDRNNLNNTPTNLAVFASQAEHLAFHHGNSNVRPIWDGRDLAQDEVA